MMQHFGGLISQLSEKLADSIFSVTEQWRILGYDL
jgi:hypothetical protein